MINIYSTDSAIHGAHDFIHVLQNSAPATPLVTLGNPHTTALGSLSKIFDKATPQGRPPCVVPQ